MITVLPEPRSLLRAFRLLSVLVLAVACDSSSPIATPDPDVPGPLDPPVGPPPPTFPEIPASGEPVFSEGGIQVVPIARGLDHPWGLAFLPSGELLVSERAGRLRIFVDGELKAAPVSGLPEPWVNGQGGLLDVATHPEFWTDSLLYVTQSSQTGDHGVTVEVVRARWTGSSLTGAEVIWTGVPGTPSSEQRHFGSRLAFDLDGYLYVSMGDRHVRSEAQDPKNHQGTVSRIHDDGRIPDDNPFLDRAGVEPSIYAYGMRNPQGLAVHPGTGRLLESEHGPRYGDEVNLIDAGDNLGWAAFSYGVEADGSPIGAQSEPPGMKTPLVYWDDTTIAPSGIDVYTGDRFPDWDGDLFVAALGAKGVIRVDLDGGLDVLGIEKLLGPWDKRIRHVRNGPDGFLYILTDEENGGIYRLEPITD